MPSVAQQTPPRPTFSTTNAAIRALASVAVGALVFGLVFGLRRDKTTTTDRVVARPASAAAKQRPPNLIVFLADDLGRNDVGYAHRDGGPGRIASPRIDALAAESLVLDRFYAQPMCTPTRAALMTGRHAYKTGLAYFVLLANQGTGLPAAEVTVAERLRDAGYSTHMIGKWHLGFAKKAMLPTSRGFDRFFFGGASGSSSLGGSSGRNALSGFFVRTCVTRAQSLCSGTGRCTRSPAEPRAAATKASTVP